MIKKEEQLLTAASYLCRVTDILTDSGSENSSYRRTQYDDVDQGWVVLACIYIIHCCGHHIGDPSLWGGAEVM